MAGAETGTVANYHQWRRTGQNWLVYITRLTGHLDSGRARIVAGHPELRHDLGTDELIIAAETVEADIVAILEARRTHFRLLSPVSRSGRMWDDLVARFSDACMRIQGLCFTLCYSVRLLLRDEGSSPPEAVNFRLTYAQHVALDGAEALMIERTTRYLLQANGYFVSGSLPT